MHTEGDAGLKIRVNDGTNQDIFTGSLITNILSLLKGKWGYAVLCCTQNKLISYDFKFNQILNILKVMFKKKNISFL